MSSYWDNKWAKAKNNWEELQSKRDSSEEILQGLKRSPGGIGKAPPKKLKDIIHSGVNVGRSIKVVATAIGATDQVPLVELKGDDESAAAVALTLQSDITQFTTPPGSSINDIFGIIEWGSGGFQATAQVDFMMGTIINLYCSWLRLTAAIEGSIGDVATFGAFAAMGHRQGSFSPQRTVTRDVDGNFINTIGPGASSAMIEIPKFAHAVELSGIGQGFPQPITLGAYSLRFFTITGGFISEAYFTSTTGAVFDYKSGVPVRWPGHARRMTIVNRDAVIAIQNPRLIFQLAL